MKILAFILALMAGGFIWFFFVVAPYAIMLKQAGGGSIGTIFFVIMLYVLYLIIRFFYKKLILKFGYDLHEDTEKEDVENIFTFVRLLIYAFICLLILYLATSRSF